jgi:hypothetical protein
VLQLEIFIRKLGTINGLSTCSIVVGKVTSLAHESWNDTMKGRTGIAIALFASAKSTKVLRRLGDDVGSQLHDDAAGGLAANGNVKVNLGVGPEMV